MNQQENNELNQNEFDGFYLTALLFKQKYFILAVVLLITGGTTFYALNLPNWYKSTTNVVPPNNVGGMDASVGAISSTLREFGLSKMGQQTGGDNYSFIVILTSRSVTDSIIKEFDLPKVYDIPETEMEKVRKAFEENVEVEYTKEGNYTISVWDTDPKRASDMANQYVNIANSIAKKLFLKEIDISLEGLEKRLLKTDSTIVNLTDSLQKFSSKYLIFSPDDQAKALSQSLSELKSQEIKYEIMADYYRNIYGKDDYMTLQQENFKQTITDKIEQIKSTPGFAGNFSVANAAEVGIEYTRLLTEFETYSKVKVFLLPTIEKSRIDKLKDQKNVIVLDKAIPAEKKDRPKRSVFVAGAFAGSFVISVLLILIYHSLASFNKKYKKIKSMI